MNCKQLVSPNLNQTGRVGYCLQYAHEMFGAPGGVSWAWTAWERTQYKHPDRDLPSDAAVLMWYSYKGTEGHVTVNVPGHGIYSSPYQAGTSHAVLGSIEDVERIYGVQYVGWSEDINGVRVAEPFVAAPTLPYTVTPIQPKQVVLNKQPTHEYHLNYQTFNEIAANPFSSGNLGDIKTVVAELHHRDGYTYYLEDSSNPIGWNVLDCNDYIPPPPPPPVYMAPAGAMTFTKPEQTTLVTALPYYGSADDCQKAQHSGGTLPAGKYFVLAKEGNNSIYYNLTSDYRKDLNHWVNILDNKVPVVQPIRPNIPVSTPVNAPSMTTAEIRASYRSIPDGPMDVSAKTNILVTDIVGPGNPITVIPGKSFHIYGTFRKNNQWYASPKINASDPEAANYLYGIPIASSTSLEPFLEATYGFPERISYGIQAWYDRTIQTIDGFFRAKRKINK